MIADESRHLRGTARRAVSHVGLPGIMKRLFCGSGGSMRMVPCVTLEGDGVCSVSCMYIAMESTLGTLPNNIICTVVIGL